MPTQINLQRELRVVTERYQSELVAAADLNEKLRQQRQQRQQADAPKKT